MPRRSKKKIVIIGGGLAGLSTAVFLTKSNYDIEIYEATPKFGGRTYSFYDKEMDAYLDNGKHIIAGWYEYTKKYLELIGSNDLIKYQKSLCISLMDSEGKSHEFNSEKFFLPLNFIYGFMKFKALKFGEKFEIIRLLLSLNNGKSGKCEYTDELLKVTGQHINSIKYFWDPMIFAIFNSHPELVSIKYLERVIQKGMSVKKHSGLGLPTTTLGEIFVENALKYLSKYNVEYSINNKIKYIKIENGKVNYINNSNGENIYDDAYVSAVPFWSYNNLLGNNKNVNFKTNSVVSIHIKMNDKIVMNIFTNSDMVGLIGTKIHWIFKDSDDRISAVISGTDMDRFVDLNSGEIINIVKGDLMNCYHAISENDFLKFKVIKEKRATFVPDKESFDNRLNNKIDIKNLYIAGDWTNTGLPSTIEGSIASGWSCAELIRKEIG